MSFAGVSVIANGRLRQGSAVCSGPASKRGYHLLVVEGYSSIEHTLNGTAIKSRPFWLGGYRWVLKLYPNGESPESTGFISLFVKLDEKEKVAQPVKVCFLFSFIDRAEKKAPVFNCADFSSIYSSWGESRFIRREALEQSEHKDDCFTIRCDFTIADPHAPFIEDPSSNIRQHFENLLETNVGTDVTFIVDGETFIAHRCFLASRSAVFMAELFGTMEEGTTDSVIQMQDMEASVFKAMLRFIYTDSLPKMEVEGEVEQGRAEAIWLQNLLVAADRYDLQRLKSMCEEQLAKHIELSSVTTLLALAAQHHCCELKEACLEFLSVQSATALQGVMKMSDWALMSTTYPCVPNELIAKLASKCNFFKLSTINYMSC